MVVMIKKKKKSLFNQFFWPLIILTFLICQLPVEKNYWCNFLISLLLNLVAS